MSKIFQHISNRRTTSAGYHLLAKAGPAMLALVLICAMLGANFTSAAAAGNQYYVDKTNIACSDTGPGSAAVPFCTLFKAWNTATVPGDTVNVVHGTYAETVYPASGTSDNLITFHAVNSDVTVTGDTAFGAGFAVTSRSYVVIDGFNIYHTKGRGIYSEDSNHIIITNNHVSYAGADTGPTTHAEGIFLSGTTYSTVSENISEHNSCIGIRLIGNSNFNTVSDNLAYSNASDIAYPNVAVSDAAGIDVTDSNNKDEVVSGNLVVWAPDANQKFPTGFGADKKLFTDDDPIMNLPAGWSVIGMDQTPFTIDRSEKPVIDLYEPASQQLDDFSQLSYSDAFDKMVDKFRKEYAWTELKKIDWDAKAQEFRPRFEAAQKNNDKHAYALALRDFIWSIPDTHVGFSTPLIPAFIPLVPQASSPRRGLFSHRSTPWIISRATFMS